jgi:hypothetical protein
MLNNASSAASNAQQCFVYDEQCSAMLCLWRALLTTASSAVSNAQ